MGNHSRRCCRLGDGLSPSLILGKLHQHTFGECRGIRREKLLSFLSDPQDAALGIVHETRLAESKPSPACAMPHHGITTARQQRFTFLRRELEDIRQCIGSLVKGALHAISKQLEKRNAK